MTQEHKELLLKDLCARLPYGVKLQKTYDTSEPAELYSIDLEHSEVKFYKYKGEGLTICDVGFIERYGKLRFKPYLFPLSSMTEEHIFEINNILGEDFEIDEYSVTSLFRGRCSSLSYLELDALFEYFDKNHFDYRGLIEKDLAIDATSLNIY